MKTAGVVGMLLTAGLLAGCTTPITMRHSDGRTTECGPYWVGGIIPMILAPQREARCVSDFQRQGFERAVGQ